MTGDGGRPGGAAARAALALLLGLGLLLGGGCATDEERFQEHRERAQEHLEAGRSREALIELRSALRVRPQSAETNFRIAEILNARGQTEEALFYYRETQRLDPDHVGAAFSEAMLLRFDDTERAKEIVQGILERFPESPLGPIGRSQIALVEVDTETALEAARRAVELAPENPETYNQLGVVRQAQLREIQLDLREPDEAIPRAAIEAFRRTAELREGPRRWEAVVNIAWVYASWPGHGEDAREAFREAVAVAEETGFKGMHARALRHALRFGRRERDVDFARWALDRRLELGEAPLRAWSALARLEQRATGEGRAVLERLVERRPDDADAHVTLATHLYRTQGLPAAEEYVEARIEEGVEAPVLLDALARMHFRKRDVAAARAIVRRLEREHPEHLRTQIARSQLAIAEDRPEEAVDVLQRAVSSYETRDGQKLLAEAHRRIGTYEKALAAVDRGIELAPGFDAGLQLVKANIQKAAGSCEAAIRTYYAVEREGHRLRPHQRVWRAQCFYELGRKRKGRLALEHLLDELEEPPLVVVVEYAERESERRPERVREVLEEALARVSGNPVLHMHLTRLDLREGRAGAARERLRRAIEASEDPHPLLRVTRARVAVVQGDLDDALEDATRAFDEAPATSGALGTLVAVHRARGEPDAALEVLREAARRRELAPGPRLALARLLIAKGELEEARPHLERVVRDVPEEATAKNDLAWLLAERGESLDRALELAREARQALGDEPSVADTLGYVYLRRGLPQPALEQFRSAVETAEARGQESPELYYHLGLALRELGREGEAAEAMERALALDGSFSGAASAREALEKMRGGAAAEAS